MYFFNIKKLKKDLIEQKLTEKERCKYFFVLAIVSFVLFLSENDEIKENYFFVIIDSLFFIVYSFFLFSIYKLFNKHNSKDFLGKCSSISFVLFIRFFVFGLLIFISLIIFSGILLAVFEILGVLTETSKLKNEILWVITLSFIFFSLLYYYRLYIHLKDVVVLENNKNVSLQNVSTEPS